MLFTTKLVNTLFLLYSSVNEVIFFCLLICFLLISFFSLDSLSDFSKRYNINTYRTIIVILCIFIFILILLKFIIMVFFLRDIIAILPVYLPNVNVYIYYKTYLHYGYYANVFGWGVLLLCFITTFSSLFYLGERNILFFNSTSLLFFFFLMCTVIMVSTTNLLVMFLSFEFIFFPSLYFVYKMGYVKKVDKAIYFLLSWTFVGSLIILSGFAYLYSTYLTLDYELLISKHFTHTEMVTLYILFFLGFSVKLPIFPFYYWLLKVHVEAPAGFSMFLSGFLVKTALYCFYYIHMLFSVAWVKQVLVLWLCFCVIESSIKMWSQVDIKKLVAYATIQEMNMIMLCIMLFQTWSNSMLTLFTIMHGLLSVYMFFLVDQIQKKAQARNIISITGLALTSPTLRILIWVMLILFLGFPFTLKFTIEFQLICLLYTQFGILGLFIALLAVVFGGLGFTKCWMMIMYGVPGVRLSKLRQVPMFKKDLYLGLFLIFCLSILVLLHYFL